MMARRRTKPTEKKTARLTSDQIRAAIPRLDRRIAELRAFEPENVNIRPDPNIERLEASIDRTLVAIFGPDTVDYRRYQSARYLDTAGYNYLYETPITKVRSGLREGIATAIALLEDAKTGLIEDLEDFNEVFPKTPAFVPATDNRDVFLVHGHDEGVKQAVARFLEGVDLYPIILHEQISKNQTLIEKFEEYGDVGFGVVLLTPDDVGADNGNREKLQPRARQNVILELGYFLGRLGRSRVCALMKGDVELPSDYSGVLFVPFDDAGYWKIALAKEINGAGLSVDFNKVAKI